MLRQRALRFLRLVARRLRSARALRARVPSAASAAFDAFSVSLSRVSPTCQRISGVVTPRGRFSDRLGEALALRGDLGRTALELGDLVAQIVAPLQEGRVLALGGFGAALPGAEFVRRWRRCARAGLRPRATGGHARPGAGDGPRGARSVDRGSWRRHRAPAPDRAVPRVRLASRGASASVSAESCARRCAVSSRASRRERTPAALRASSASRSRLTGERAQRLARGFARRALVIDETAHAGLRFVAAWRRCG